MAPFFMSLGLTWVLWVNPGCPKYEMKILVTGGNGFIGRRLTSTLKENGFDVTPFGSSNLHSKDWIQDRDQTFYEQFDVIFHLAAIPRVGVSLETPGPVLLNNFVSTEMLLDFCRMSGGKQKIIYASSSSVKFADLTRNPYALSKKFGEDLMNLYATAFNMQTTSVRFFNVFGPGESDEYGTKHQTIVKAFKNCIHEGRNFKVNGDGSAFREFTYIDDVVSGLLRILMEMQRGDHKPLYEIGSQATQVRQIAEAFQEGTNLQIEYGPPRAGDPLGSWSNEALFPVGYYPTVSVLNHIRDWKAAGCPLD